MIVQVTAPHSELSERFAFLHPARGRASTTTVRETGTGWTSTLLSPNGNMSGDGDDDVGRFLVKGRYDAASLECHWTKTYVGSHDVFYRGFREGKGIWGTWEIGLLAHGGFHIWPRQAGEGEARVEGAASEEPVDAIATQEVAAGRE